MSKLVDGCIPANTVCPFWNECEIRMDRCPRPDKVKPHEFSCGAARGFDIIKKDNGNENLA